jgi:hypothetical protein
MGIFLATSLFATTLLAGLSGILVLDALRPRLALLASAPRGIIPYSQKSNSFLFLTAKRSIKIYGPGLTGVDEVTR